jgi:hypothetical protein
MRPATKLLLSESSCDLARRGTAISLAAVVAISRGVEPRSRHSWRIASSGVPGCECPDCFPPRARSAACRGLGARLDGYVEFAAPPRIRIGNSLLGAVPDIDPYLRPVTGSPAGGPVIGASLARLRDAIAVAGRAGDTLLIRGESGAGKELAARRLHEVCFGPGSSAPFVAVNCAAIPEGLAERLWRLRVAAAPRLLRTGRRGARCRLGRS